MAFQEVLENAVKKFNNRVKFKSEYQKILEKYAGRIVTLNVKDDAIYIFHLSPNEVKLEISSENHEEDMYLETSKEIFQKIIEERRISPQDLLRGRIKWKNISLKDVRRIKKILGIKSLEFKKQDL
ncbi:hypothetical protein CW703_02915 [Candidatus Bathyarchaeota archaeon]|nr:MAG: hypothetical protein CW703_02915 [Candidatus Bathyarchaeota archaeon]